MKRILFIGHDAGRTGAPFVLLHLLEWLHEREPELTIGLHLLRGGELVDRYRKTVDKLTIEKTGEPSFAGRQIERISKRFGIASNAKIEVPPGDYQLVVGNTVATLQHLEASKRSGRRTICWLHELEHIIRSFYSIDRFLALSESVDHFICGSEAVKNNIEKMGVKTPASVVYEISPVVPVTGIDPAAVKRDLGIAPDSFVVFGGGTVQWRKGTDLFLQIADRVSKGGKPVNFVWLGGRTPDTANDFAQVEFDLIKMGLRGKVTFTGVVSDPEKYLASADLFALTSREDPFPLICLQAAALGKPVLCFENSGGMPEFVGADAGAVIPYGDVIAFAESILSFLDDPGRLRAAGERAFEKVSSDFAPQRSLLSMERIMKTVASGGIVQ